MAWRYNQGTGEIQDAKGQTRGRGYAGHGPGKNNPLMERVKNVGPIPRGLWGMQHPIDSKLRGPYVIMLDPEDGTETYGRSGFLVHGDSRTHPGEASHGCIVCGRKLREAMWESGDHLIEVHNG